MRNLGAQGFADVYISVNYLAEVIIDHVGDGSALGLNVRYVHEDKPLGTAGALAALTGTIGEPFMVMNSDLLTQVNLREMLTFHAKGGARARSEYESTCSRSRTEWSTSTARWSSRWSRSLCTGRSSTRASTRSTRWHARNSLAGEYADMPTLLGLLKGDGYDVAAFPIHESWLDVGRPEDLSQARTEFDKWIGA